MEVRASIILRPNIIGPSLPNHDDEVEGLEGRLEVGEDGSYRCDLVVLGEASRVGERWITGREIVRLIVVSCVVSQVGSYIF